MDLLREIDKLLTEAQRQSDDLNDQRDHGRVDGLEEARELAVAYIKHRQEADARIRALEDENQRMRDNLEAATRFQIGDVTITRRSGGWHRCNWPIPRLITPPGSKSGGTTMATENYSTRDAALSRAREIAEEEA